jgi:hypothetical protein
MTSFLLTTTICTVESDLESDIQQADALIETITKEKVEYESQNKIQVNFSLFSRSFVKGRVQ